MDDDILHNLRKSNVTSGKWQMDAPSAMSFEFQDSDQVVSPLDQHVQLVTKKEVRSLRRKIPATWRETLAYYRCYQTATTKSPMFLVQYLSLNRFIWDYVLNFFFKNIPQAYIYLFLASYAPDEHFFLSKMVPLSYGFIFVYIVTAVVDIIMYVTKISLLLDYTIMGIKYKNPWFRCDFTDGGIYVDGDFENVTCYKINDFMEIFLANETILVSQTAFFGEYGFFNIAPMAYLEHRELKFTQALVPNSRITLNFLYFLLLWLIMNTLQHNKLYRRCIWKVLYIVHWMVNSIYIAVFFHVLLQYFLQQFDNTISVIHLSQYLNETIDTTVDDLIKANVDLYAESMTVPPSMHILPARMHREINVSEGSLIISVSNGIYFIFKGLLSYRLKKYCDSILRVELPCLIDGSASFYYFWPIYFSTYYLGELYLIIFFLLHFLMEFACVSITYQCLLEAIVCEWRLAKRAIVTAVLFCSATIIIYFTDLHYFVLRYLFTKWIANMLEVIGIYIIYPLGRLIDDITFFTGVTPTKLRIINLKLVPVYYGIKMYYVFANFSVELFDEYFIETGAMILIGIIIVCYFYIYKQRKPWALFRPDSNWGPEYTVRQMRKQYDSREYIGSQAPRVLSRYMIHKAEAKAYKLDIRYDNFNRRSSTPNSDFYVVNEKKNI